jgi:hypothetical protein
MRPFDFALKQIVQGSAQGDRRKVFRMTFGGLFYSITDLEMLP